MTIDIESLAQQVFAAQRDGRELAEFAPELGPQTFDEAYRVQDRVAELRGGGTPGFKLGMGAPAALRKNGLDGPLVGRCAAGRLLDDGAEIACPAWRPAIVELELAAVLARDIDPDEAAPAPDSVVAEWRLGFEIVASRLRRGGGAGARIFVTDDVGCHALVAGPVTSPSAVASGASLYADGVLVGAALSGDDCVDPATGLGQFLAHCRARKLPLKKGQLISTGTLVAPWTTSDSCTIEGRLGAARVTARLVFR